MAWTKEGKEGAFMGDNQSIDLQLIRRLREGDEEARDSLVV